MITNDKLISYSFQFILDIFNYFVPSVLFVLIFFLSSFVTGCANFGYPKTGPDCVKFDMKALPFPTEQLNFETFTVTPPQGENWCIAHLDRELGTDSIEMVLLFKNQFGGRILQKSPSPSEANQSLSIVFGVDDLNDMLQKYAKAVGKDINNVSSIDELVNYAQKYIEIELSNPNIKTIRKSEVSSYLPPDKELCVKMSYVIEATQLSLKRPNEVYLYDSNTIQCIHPTRPLMFTIHYSERYPAQDPPAFSLIKRYRHEIEPCINGFELKP